MLATLLMLADSRLPAGGHAHSAGAEQAVTDRVVTDEATLAAYLRRRLATSGAVAAGLAAAAAALTGLEREGLGAELARLDEEADARTPLAATRLASRAQGRGLVRVGRRAWPAPVWGLLPRAPHHAIALGVAAATGGASAHEAAIAAAYLSLTGPAAAVQRLLGLDPVAVTVLLAAMRADLHGLADAVVGADVPMESDVLSDLLTAGHTSRQDKLFAS